MDMNSVMSLNVGLRQDSFKKSTPFWKVNLAYLPLKIIYFTFMAGQSSQVLFRALFMKHLGMSTTQNGIIWTIDRVCGMVISPALGWIVDKSGKPKTVIVWLFTTGALLVACFYFIHPEHATDEFESNFCFSAFCQSRNSTTIDCSSQTGAQFNCFTVDEDFKTDFHNRSCVDEMDTSNTFANKSLSKTEENISLQTNLPFYGIMRSNLTQHAQVYCDFNLTYSSLSGSITQSITSQLPFPNQSICLCLVNSTLVSDEHITADEYGMIFWSTTVLIVVSSISVMGGNTVIDTLVLGVFPEEERHNFGYQRLWGAIGFGLSPVIIGMIKDKIASLVSDPHSNLIFLPVLLAPVFFWSFLCIATWKISSDVVKKKSAQTIQFSKIKILISNIRIIAFLIFSIAVGFALSVGEIYMFWLAEVRFNASSTILALTAAIASTIEVFTYIASGTFIKKFDCRLIMSCATCLLALRLLLYTFVTESWHLIFAESLRGFGWPGAWVAMCNHIAHISPPGLETTTMGLVQAAMFGCGYASGAYVGGYLFEEYGGIMMFRISFGLTTSVAILYFVTYKCIDHWKPDKVKNLATPDEDSEPLELNNNIPKTKFIPHDLGEDHAFERNHCEDCIMLETEVFKDSALQLSKG